MIQRLFLLFTLILFACNSESNPAAPVDGADPVTVVTIGLSNVNLDLADESAVASFKTAFANDLAASLSTSGFSIDASRIQILDIIETTSRGNFDIEFLFLESEDNTSVSVDDLLNTLAEDNFDVESSLFDIEDIGFTETDNAASCSVMLDIAEDELVNLLTTIYSCPSGEDDCHVESMDYEELYGYYQDALEYCPSEPAANFGAAVTGMLTVTTDETLWEFYENWRAWEGDDNFIFPDGDRAFGSPSSGFGLPNGINSFFIADQINFIDYLPLSYLVSYISMFEDGDDPPFVPDLEEIMTIIETEFIGRLSSSIEYLENTVGQNYSFVITAEMQDDPDQGDLEMDDTEFYAMTGAMHLLRATLYGVTAYSIDVDYETGQSDFSYLEQNSSFLAIRNSNALPNAHDDLMAMITSLSNGIDFLANESDGQTDDLIHQNEISTFNQEHEYTITEYLDPDTGIAQEYFNDNFTEEICECGGLFDDPIGTMTGFYDSCDEEDCFDLTINLKNFMQSPPNNLKEIMPDYTITTTTEIDYDTWNQYYGWWYDANLDLTSCNLDNWGLYYNYQEYDENFNASTDIDYYFGNAETCEALTDYAQELYNNILDYVNSSSEIVSFLNFQIQLSESSAYVGISYAEMKPCIEWDAETFDEWKSDIGDYTLSGLFPEMTMQQFFNDILEIVEEDVEPPNGVVDWWDKHGDGCSDDASEGF